MKTDGLCVSGSRDRDLPCEAVQCHVYYASTAASHSMPRQSVKDDPTFEVELCWHLSTGQYGGLAGLEIRASRSAGEEVMQAGRAFVRVALIASVLTCISEGAMCGA